MSRRDTAVFEAMCDLALDDDRDRDAEHWAEYDRLMEAADTHRKERNRKAPDLGASPISKEDQ